MGCWNRSGWWLVVVAATCAPGCIEVPPASKAPGPPVASADADAAGSNDATALTGDGFAFDGVPADGADGAAQDADAATAGGFMTPCTFNEDCTDGLCVILDLTTGESVCTQYCVTECPEGWGCKPYSVGSDVYSYCMPKVDALCHACKENSDCGYSGALCLAVEGGHCGQDCAAKDSPCPQGFACVAINGPDNEPIGKQCVPKHGSCQCEATIDFQTSTEHCGGCNQPCKYDNGVPTCVGGKCHLAACIDGWHDLDKMPESGCEYPCVAGEAGTIDWPDSSAVDSDCDGIDGDLERAVFVAPDGVDAGNTAGSMELPFKTLKAAMTFAVAADDRDQVLVSKGSYVQQLVVVEKVHVFGAYDRSAGWKRNLATNETIVRWEAVDKGAVRTLVAASISEPTTIDGLTIEASSNPAASGSSIAVHITGGSPGLVLSNCRVVAGNGGHGTDGANGSPGQGGDEGSDGTEGVDDSCKPEKPVLGGKGGKNTCETGAASGGDGGDAGWGEAKSCAWYDTVGCLFDCKGRVDAKPGQTAPGVGGGTGGAGGPPEEMGMPGGAGAEGPVGLDGAGGDGAGFIGPDELWHSNAGTPGGPGQYGTGGGGGGGGGGSDNGAVGDAASHGGGGGGGGAGGCGGTGGKSGTGGGASIAILVVGSAPTISNDFIVFRNGGNGGTGGVGGTGGTGGTGGAGGKGWDSSAPGGPGGGGANGGRGGHGGGGGGGPSVGILNWGDAGTLCSGNVFSQEGTSGLGGIGGDGSIESANGKAGITNQIVNPTLGCMPE